MRLGVLEFGLEVAWGDGLLHALSKNDIDTVPSEVRIESLETARTEAKRLSRADCDGILLLIGSAARTDAVAAAGVLLAGVPLLLSNADTTAAYFESAGALEEIGARFDRMPAEAKWDADTFVKVWLNEVGKAQRHRGMEAARKLYGQSLYVPLGTGGLPDAALWMHQFGIIPTAEAEGADLSAPTGDACGALTDHLLRLVSAQSLVTPVSLAAVPVSCDPDPDNVRETLATFARITRTKGRFRCLLVRGALQYEESFPARFECSEAELDAVASSHWLHAVPGDHLGAMRAACEALDIDTVVLRPVHE